jgi:hypothetical protein
MVAIASFVDTSRSNGRYALAGPAFAEKDLPCVPRGGVGFGIRTLVTYLQALWPRSSCSVQGA